MRITISLIFITLFLSGCNDEEVQKTKSGYFTLSQLKSPSNGRISSSNDVAADFDLGDLKASREFYFILNNGGENPITDITLETNDTRFLISPQNIGTLPSASSSGAIIPLISLGVIHGVQLNGVGFTDVLEMGDNSSVLTITGKTTLNGEPIDLKSEFVFSVNAKKIDIILSENGNEIDLVNPIGFTGWTDIGGLGTVPLYSAPTKAVKIKNIGNVDLIVTTRFLLAEEIETQITLTPNQSVDLELKNDEINEFTTIISLDGNGTISDNNRLQMGNNGKAYFAIQN